MENSNNNLNLPYTFKVEENEWNDKLSEITSKSTIGSLIILGLCVAVNLILGISLPTLVFVGVFLLLFVTKQKEKKELSNLGGLEFKIDKDAISIVSPTNHVRTVAFSELKSFQKLVWGIKLEPVSKDQEVIKIPVTVPHFDSILEHFQKSSLSNDN